MRAYCLKMIGQLVILALIYMRISLFRTLGVNHHSAHAESMLHKGFYAMNQKKFIIITQVFISGMMAFVMTLFFSILNLGLNSLMIQEWLTSFAIAWPVAFLFSLVISPLAFAISGKMFNFKL